MSTANLSVHLHIGGVEVVVGWLEWIFRIVYILTRFHLVVYTCSWLDFQLLVRSNHFTFYARSLYPFHPNMANRFISPLPFSHSILPLFIPNPFLTRSSLFTSSNGKALPIPKNTNAAHFHRNGLITMQNTNQ